MPLTEAQAEALVEQLADDAALLHGVVHGDAETEVVTEGGTVPSVAKVIATAEDALTGSVALAEAWADKAEDEEVETDKYSARHWAAKAAAIRDSLVNVVEFKGAFDASEGEFPAEPDIGDLYAVTVGGTVSGNVLVSGDEIIYGPSGWIVVGRNLSASEVVTLLVGNFTDAAHGNRGGGTLHALATTSVAGFMSADDKAYVDGLPAALKNKLADPEGNGLISRTGVDGATAARTITGTANQVIVSNGDGVSGNPTLSLPQDINTNSNVTFARLDVVGSSNGVMSLSGGSAATIELIDTGAGTDAKRAQILTNDGVVVLRSRKDDNTSLRNMFLVDHAVGNFLPGHSGTQNCGGPGSLWKEIFASIGAISSSDARLKTDIRAMSEDERGAATELAREIGVYQFLEAVAAKGAEDARWHIGMTVQRAIEIMESHDLDPMKYGFVCYDEWDERVEEIPAFTKTHPAVLDENGEEVEPEWVETLSEAETITHPAGNSFGFRADQLLLFIMRGMAADADVAAARMDDLESRLSALEGSA